MVKKIVNFSTQQDQFVKGPRAICDSFTSVHWGLDIGSTDTLVSVQGGPRYPYKYSKKY